MGVTEAGTNGGAAIPDDLRERYDKCCNPDEPEYSAWECTLIERIAELEAKLEQANANLIEAKELGQRAADLGLELARGERVALESLERQQRAVTDEEMQKFGRGWAYNTRLRIDELIQARASSPTSAPEDKCIHCNRPQLSHSEGIYCYYDPKHRDYIQRFTAAGKDGAK